MKLSKEQKIYLGISSCLLGEKVRYDSGHKKDRYVVDILGKYFEWVPVCPEVEVGMGVPREAVRLVGDPENPRMVGIKSGTDWTHKISDYSEKKVNILEKISLSGYIFKSDSPSCGMERVRVYTSKGIPSKNGRGIFANAFMKKYPLVPVEEEGRLNDEGIRENFIERVFCYHRLQQLTNHHFSIGELVDFHTKIKYLMLAHSNKHYIEMGRLVARAKEISFPELRDTYSRLLMEGLKIKTTTTKNVNVLHHILGFLSNKLTTKEKANIISVIDDYRHSFVPLIVPLTLIKHYVTIFDIPYIRDQIYLTPHPKELMLRNHV